MYLTNKKIMETKICTKCKKEKSVKEFYKDLNSSDQLTSKCKSCHKEYRDLNREKQRIYMQNLRNTKNEIIKENKRKAWGNADPRKLLLMQARNRAKRKNIDFNLTLEDIIIPEVCPLLNIPFVRGVKNDYEYTYSLDRIDPTKGYLKDNIWVITKLANSMKNSASKEQLLVFAENVIKYFK